MKRVWITSLVATLIAALAAVAAGPAFGSSDGCTWLAGDLHVHTQYSHDVWAGPDDDNTTLDEFYTYGWTVSDEVNLATTRGLDYVAITDHNDVRSQVDPGWQYGTDQGLIMVPAYENSTPGHTQAIGATRVYEDTNDNRRSDDEADRDFDNDGDQDLADIQKLSDMIHADGGVMQINHPGDGKWINFLDHTFVPDTVEIWNIGLWAYEPPFTSVNAHEKPPAFYDEFLDAGNHVGATGGSDSHWRSTTVAQGVGQPTTYVCAAEASVQGILDGIRAGRTTISHEPPNLGGAFATLRADSDGDGTFESPLSSTVTPGTAIQVSVDNAPGAKVRLVTNGSQTAAEIPVDSPSFTTTFTPADDVTWIRAEIYYDDLAAQRKQMQPLCDQLAPVMSKLPTMQQEFAYCQSRLAVVAMTSPIYFQAPQFDPTTTLTYDGSTSAKPGSTTTFGATLVGSDGPISGAAITFTYRGTTYNATTDDSGRASIGVKVVGPPGTYQVGSNFAGSDVYSASQDFDPFTVTPGH